MKSAFLGPPNMMPSAASMLAALGVALLFSRSDSRPFHKSVALFGSMYALLLGATYLYTPAGMETLLPWVIAPAKAASVSLMLLGVAVLLLQARRPPVALVAWSAIFGGVLALHRLLTLVMGMNALEPSGLFGNMAPSLAIGVFLLATCGILMHSRLHLAAHFFADDLRGRLLRLMLPWSAFAPILALALAAWYIGDEIHTESSIVAMVAGFSIVITTAVWLVADKLQLAEDERTLAEASMNVALTKYKSLFDAIPLGITVTDEVGNIVETNLAAEKLLGVPPEVHRQRRLGSPEWHLVRKDGTRMPPDEYPSMRALREKRRIENVELGVVKPDNTTTWLRVSSSPIPLQGSGVVVIYGDIGERMQAERSLRIEQQRAQEERDRTQLYLDVAEVFIVVLDENARIQRINRKGCEILGWSEAELLDQPWLNYCAEYVRDVWNIYHKELMADRVTTEKMSEYPVISRSGGELLIDWRRHVLRDAAGKAYGTVSSGLDVTAERLVQRTLAQYQDELELLVKARTLELESSEEKLRLILDSSMEGIFGLDAEGCFTFVNPAACQMLGYSSAQLIGQAAHPLIHHTQADGRNCPPEQCPILSVLRENLLVRGDAEVLWRSDGQPVPVEFTAASVHKLGVIIGAVASFHDISLRKATEAATQTALQEARRLARVRSDFLANMSHEIRTPLNGVIGLAQVGLRTSRGRKSYNSFSRILDSSQLLLSVVNDILDFSKIEAGKLLIERTPFALGEALDHAVDIIAARAFSKGLALELAEDVDLPEIVVGDQIRLTQVLTNLISNAVKFTQHGRICLSAKVRAAQTGVPGILFQLEDSGIGMTDEQMARLFQPFEQADGSTTRRFGGTGLGLTISKRLVDAMGGEIQVESHLGTGTRFKVWLPLVAAQSSAQPPVPAGLGMVLAGFAAPETESLCAALQARGMRAVAVPLAAAFDWPATDLIVLAGEALRGKADISALTLALQKKQRVAVVMTPGMEGKLSFRVQEQVDILYRPLRVRHLLMAATHEVLHKAAGVAPERLAGLHVLAAEDNELNQIVLEDILTLEGAVVMLAANGREALDRLHEQGAQAFDVVLTDIQMPEMDGYELARHVIELAPGLPIIGLTANAMPEDREYCLGAGMADHVTKPIDIDVLVNAILRHVAQHPAALSAADSTPVAAARPPPVGAAIQESMLRAAHEIIDWAALEQRFNGRQDFIDKLVSTTLASHATTPAKLREAAGRADLDAVAFIAHSLKGLGGNLFARQVNELGARTETRARSGEPGAAALGAQLADTLEMLLAALAARGQN